MKHKKDWWNYPKWYAKFSPWAICYRIYENLYVKLIRNSYKVVRLEGVTKEDLIKLGEAMLPMLHRYFPEKFENTSTYWFPEIPDLYKAVVSTRLHSGHSVETISTDPRLQWVLETDDTTNTFGVWDVYKFFWGDGGDTVEDEKEEPEMTGTATEDADIPF